MIKYRPQRGSLSEAMEEAKEFKTIDEMYEHILSDWNNQGFGQLFKKEDLSVTDINGDDKRVGWINCRYVCTKQIGNEFYDVPQCIGICSIEEE